MSELPVMPQRTRLISVESLKIAFGNKIILQDIDLEITSGKITTLIGPNGAGKTTLVNAILGLIKPSSGKVIRHPGLRIGYMPQKLALNSAMPLSVLRFLKLAEKDKRKIAAVLDRVGISALQDRSIHDVSGGELQRVLLARALLREPTLLVLDEPVQGIDVSGQEAFYQLIQTLRDETQCAIFMVSHDLHVVMAKTDTVICLNQHICCHGHPEEVGNHPEYLALFGNQNHDTLAVYQHHHDHDHSLHGEIINEK